MTFDSKGIPTKRQICQFVRNSFIFSIFLPFSHFWQIL